MVGSGRPIVSEGLRRRRVSYSFGELQQVSFVVIICREERIKLIEEIAARLFVMEEWLLQKAGRKRGIRPSASPRPTGDWSLDRPPYLSVTAAGALKIR